MGQSTTRADVAGFSDVSGVVLAHLLAPALADLGSVPDTVEGDGELVDVAVALARLEAWAAAQRARTIVVLLERTRADLARVGAGAHRDGRGTASAASHGFDDERLAARMVSTELSLALGVTSWVADRELDLAAGLADHPPLRVALASGRLDRRRAEMVLEEISHLPEPAVREQVVASLVGDGTHAADAPDGRAGLVRELSRPGTSLTLMAPGVLRRAVRRECLAADTHLAARREAKARRGRHLEFRTLPDGMGELTVHAPGYAIGAAFTNVDRAARAARERGDWRTLEQLRCDIAVGWLTEGAFGTLVVRRDAEAGRLPAQTGDLGPANDPADVRAAPKSRDRFSDEDLHQVSLPRVAKALIVMTMPARTALGMDDQPAMLHGPGGATPMTAQLARDIAHDPTMSTWLGLFTDPATGIAVDISPRYRPPARMSTFVKLRDGLRSRLPSSGTGQIELDHIRPYNHDQPARGGQTTPSDLASAGLREHHLKTDGALHVSGDANGPLTFTTHARRWYVSWPELWEDPPTFVDGPPLPRQHRPPDNGDPPY